MYIMKISTFSILISLALLIVIIMSLSSSCAVLPYRVESTTLHESPYEGFRSIIEYTTYPNNESIDSNTSKDIVQSKDESLKRVSGFDGLVTSPNAPEQPLDIFSQATSSPTCKSYGYMNSRGFLCLNPEQIQLLTTRGGNLGSNDATIGVSK